jgi:hypothetical protein
MTKDELIRQIADRNPLIPSEVDGGLSCYFCYAIEPDIESGQGHEWDCLWNAAVGMVQSGEVR